MENSIKIYVDNLPKGSIIMWYGDETKIPDGWKECNGQNGTPNLRDKFIVGAGGAYRLNDYGGQTTVTLVENQMPSHTHNTRVAIEDGGEHKHQWRGYYRKEHDGSGSHCRSRNWIEGDPIDDDTNEAGEHNHKANVNEETKGGNESHENLPPYFALYYIMKTI